MSTNSITLTLERLAKRIRALETRDQFQGRLSATGAIYFGNPDVNGTWRIICDGDDLVEQRRELDVWVTKHTVTP